MSKREVAFFDPVAARLKVSSGWVDISLRKIEHVDPPGTLRLTLSSSLAGERVWRSANGSVRSGDPRVSAILVEARKREITAKITGTLRGIADMAEAFVKGEP